MLTPAFVLELPELVGNGRQDKPGPQSFEV